MRNWSISAATTLIVASQASYVAAQDREIVWTNRAETGAQAQLAQEQFLLTLFNTGRLPFRDVPLGTRTNLEQVMREEGAWVGPMTQQVASMLCEVNRDHCVQDSEQVDLPTLANPGAHVGGNRGLDLRWTVGARANEVVRIPDLQIVQVWKPEPAERGALVDEAGIAINQNCLTESFCIDDYLPKSGFTDQVGVLREVIVATPDPSGAGLALELVPHLGAVVNVPEAPLGDYQQLNQQRATTFDFRDQQFKKLNESLSNDIVGTIELKLESSHEAGAFTGFGAEPLAEHTKSVLDSFCNRPIYGECPDLDITNLSSVAIAIVDQVPITEGRLDLSHCDLGQVSIIRLNDRTVMEHQAELTDYAHACDTLVQAHQVLPEHHGIHVLGLLAARHNERGMSGLLSGAPRMSFVIIPFDRVLADQGDPLFAFNVAEAIDAAVVEKKVSVFNLSFSYDPPEDGGRDEIRDRIEKWKDHALFVVAGGKEGDDANEGPCETRPACFAESLFNIVSVVGLETTPDIVALLANREEAGRYLTNFGHKNFMLGAPARNIVSTVGNSSFGPATGTSQAAPQVTAAAALLMSKRTLEPKKARERLVYSSRLSLETTDLINGGALDATAALMSEVDQIRLNDGCRLTGKTLDLRREIDGDLGPGSFDMTFLSGPQLSRPLSAMRRMRMHWNSSKGIFFFKLNGKLEREVATFSSNPEQHIIRINTESVTDACDGRFNIGDLVSIRLSEIVDFIAKME